MPDLKEIMGLIAAIIGLVFIASALFGAAAIKQFFGDIIAFVVIVGIVLLVVGLVVLGAFIFMKLRED